MADLTRQHKNAMAEGRRRSRVVRKYLEALESSDHAESQAALTESLEKLGREIAEERDPIRRLKLIQRRADVEKTLSLEARQLDLEERRADFIAVAAEYSTRFGIERPTWEEMGVPADVLDQAGI